MQNLTKEIEAAQKLVSSDRAMDKNLKARWLFCCCVRKTIWGIKSPWSCLPWCCFWGRCRELELPSCWHPHCHKFSLCSCILITWGLLNMESVCFDTTDRRTDGGSSARCLSSWQGWGALGRGAAALSTPCLIWRRPISSFYPAWVKHTHPSQPLPCFLQGIQQYFAAIFLPPLVAVSQGRHCSNITDTSRRLGSNE